MTFDTNVLFRQLLYLLIKKDLIFEGNLLKFFLADNDANEEQDPIHSSPMPNAEDRRKRITLDISPIHHIPKKKTVNHSNVEEETERDAQFSAILRRCEECQVEGE